MLRIVVCAFFLRCHVILAAVSAIRCRTPLGPKNGRAIYSSFEYGAELEYECDEGFVLQNHHPRICNEEGIWSNEEPECIDGCLIPALNHGDIKELKFEDYCWSWRTFRYERETRYVKIPPGTILTNSSAIKVFCYKPYSFQGTSESNQEITCLNGHLLPVPDCLLASCKDPPPEIEHGQAEAQSTVHNSIVKYTCRDPYTLSRNSKVQCLYGDWTGQPPKCEDNGCVIPVLHDGDMKKMKFGDFYWNWRTCRYERKSTYVKISPGTALANGSAVMLFCRPSCFFQGTFSRKKGITCLNGHWFPDPICLRSIHTCQVNKSETSNLIVDPAKDYYTFGDYVVLSCPPGQKLTSEVVRMICLGSTWSNTLPDCIEMKEPNLARFTTAKSE